MKEGYAETRREKKRNIDLDIKRAIQSSREALKERHRWRQIERERERERKKQR